MVFIFFEFVHVSKALKPFVTSFKPLTETKYQRTINFELNAELYAKELSLKPYYNEINEENKILGKNIETVSSSVPTFPMLERVSRGLARLTEIIPKNIRLAVVAVASSLLLFELSKTLLFLAVPIIAVLGKHCLSES